MSLKIETAFPGGNVFIENIDGFEVTLARDMRNTEGNWFYWAFRALFDEIGVYRFAFTQENSCTSGGPAVSYDDGLTWEWLGFECVSGERNVFTYFYDGTKNSSVIFCVGMMYMPKHLEVFLAKHADSLYITRHVLAVSRKNREVPHLHIEDKSIKTQKKNIFFASRNHCCEMTATYALEGILEAALGNDDLGRTIRSRYIIDCVPFVDIDGVVDGDQGKNRRPHDHNRDYGTAPIYPEVAALQKLVLETQPFFALDMHCPWLYAASTNDESVYFPMPQEEEYSECTALFSQILERRSPADAPHYSRDNVPFGTMWNVAKNYSDGTSCSRWIRRACSPKFSNGIEIAYAKIGDKLLTADAVRSLGRAILESIVEFDDTVR